MTADSYIKLVINKLNSSESVTYSELYDYCINNADRLDPGDEARIINLIDDTLDSLCHFGKVSYDGINYFAEVDLSDTEVYVEARLPKMSTISKKSIDTLDNIEENMTLNEEPLLKN